MEADPRDVFDDCVINVVDTKSQIKYPDSILNGKFTDLRLGGIKIFVGTLRLYDHQNVHLATITFGKEGIAIERSDKALTVPITVEHNNGGQTQFVFHDNENFTLHAGRMAAIAHEAKSFKDAAQKIAEYCSSVKKNPSQQRGVLTGRN